jgi:hypothetical protein
VAGLLVLGEIDHAGGIGDELLADLASLDSHAYQPSCWGLSLAAHYSEDAAMPSEVSIVHEPAHPDARVFAIGPRALRVWDLLTEQRDDGRTTGRLFADRW